MLNDKELGERCRSILHQDTNHRKRYEDFLGLINECETPTAEKPKAVSTPAADEGADAPDPVVVHKKTSKKKTTKKK
jgi:hypothetical protein